MQGNDPQFDAIKKGISDALKLLPKPSLYRRLKAKVHNRIEDLFFKFQCFVCPDYEKYLDQDYWDSKANREINQGMKERIAELEGKLGN